MMFSFVARKSWLIALLLGVGLYYLSYAERVDSPFAELLYAVVLMSFVFLGGPLFRMLAFPWAAHYAETGQLKRDLENNDQMYSKSERLTHYRISTAISYGVVVLCVFSLM